MGSCATTRLVQDYLSDTIVFLHGCTISGHKFIRPKGIHDPEIVDELSKEYIYFSCIKFINSVSKLSWAHGAASLHLGNSFSLSDQDRLFTVALSDVERYISGIPFFLLINLISASLMSDCQVKTWDKVNSGMQKMYLAEVLGKLPVMQHFLFGSILAYDGPASPNEDNDHDDTHRGHAHAHEGDLGGAGQQSTGFGDCCGIPIPSAFGAAQADKGKPLAGIRPVPFD
jgi:serine/threonine-protein phosphatase 2A activator